MLLEQILKLDCEGYEYDIIGKAKNEVLRNFSEIFIEYHHGRRSLEHKLKGCGFKVRGAPPFYVHRIGGKINVLNGYILAKRI